MRERLSFAASVEVRAEPAEVFTVVSDLRRKARLNPSIEVIGVELEGGEPVREGSVFSHRFRKGGQIVEYRSRCVRCVPPSLFESRGETDPPFEVRVTIRPTRAGCHLTQEETLWATPELLDTLDGVAAPGRTAREVMRVLPILGSLGPLGSELRALQRERLVRKLRDELGAWLDAIRAHLEDGRRRDGPGERTVSSRGTA